MKLYKSKKKVRAFQFVRFLQSGDDGSTCILLGREAYGIQFRIEVDTGWLEQHKPQEGDYIVTYETGYVSRNIAEVFEKEHERIVGGPTSVINASGFPFQSKKIVCADVIDIWGAELGGGSEVRHKIVTIGGFTFYPKNDVYERLLPSLPHEGRDGAYLVIYSNGYVSVSPMAEFDKGYDPLTV